MPITKLQSSRDFFRIWFFWKKQAIFLFLFIVVLVMFYAYAATPKFRTVAKLMLLPKSNQELVLTDGNDPRQTIQRVTLEDLNTEIDLLKSDKVIIETINSFNGNKLDLKVKERGFLDSIYDSISKLYNRVLLFLQLKEESLSHFDSKVAFIKRSLSIEASESNILEVSFVAERPKRAVIVLEKIIDAYIKHHNKVFSIEEGFDFYDDQTDIYKQKLNTAEQNLKDFYENSKIINLEGQNVADIRLFTELKKQLQYLEIDYDEIKTRTGLLEKYLNNNEIVMTEKMRTIPSIMEFEKGIVPLIIQRAKIGKTFTKSSREYRDISNQIEVLQAELRSETRKALATDKLEAAALKAKIDSLHKKITEILDQAVILKEKERNLNELKRQVDFHKGNYLNYNAKKESSRLYFEKRQRNLANVTVVDPPSPPTRPFSPNKILLLFASIFCGLVTALTAPFILESLDQKLKTADDIEILLELPVISSFLKTK